MSGPGDRLLIRETDNGWFSRTLPAAHHDRATALALAHGLLVAHPDDPTYKALTTLGRGFVLFAVRRAGGDAALRACAPAIRRFIIQPDTAPDLRALAEAYRARPDDDAPFDAYSRLASAALRLACVLDDDGRLTVAGWSFACGALATFGGLEVDSLPVSLFATFQPTPDVDPELLAALAIDNERLC